MLRRSLWNSRRRRRYEVHDDHEQHVLSGDEILHKVCCVLDNRNWVLQKNIDVTEDNVSIYFEKQLNAVEFIFCHYEDIFKTTKCDISFNKVRDEFVNIVMFSLNNINVTGVQPKQFWNFIHQRKDNKEWDHIMLLIELCWCAPFSNATLECFFSQMNVMKIDWRNRLGAENLSYLLRIKVEGPNFAEFRKDFCEAAVNSWYNDKPRRLNQRKQKQYVKQSTTVKTTKLDYNLPSIFNESDGSSSNDNEF